MKQHITVEQIKELNESQMAKLKEVLVYSSQNFKEGEKFYIEDDADYIKDVHEYEVWEVDDNEDTIQIDYDKIQGEYIAVKNNGHKNFDILFNHFEKSEYEEDCYYEVQCVSYGIDDVRVYPLLSIGKMIEILENNNYHLGDTTREWIDGVGDFDWNINIVKDFGISEDCKIQTFSNLELCDALCEAVKEIL